jgi:hypothetical protein
LYACPGILTYAEEVITSFSWANHISLLELAE